MKLIFTRISYTRSIDPRRSTRRSRANWTVVYLAYVPFWPTIAHTKFLSITLILPSTTYILAHLTLSGEFQPFSIPFFFFFSVERLQFWRAHAPNNPRAFRVIYFYFSFVCQVIHAKKKDTFFFCFILCFFFFGSIGYRLCLLYILFEVTFFFSFFGWKFQRRLFEQWNSRKSQRILE